MGKSRRGGKDKEFDEIQRLKQENKKLRAQVTKLRNVVRHVDTNHYQFVQEMLSSEVFQQDSQQAEKDLKKKLECQWGCNDCGKGVMRLTILHRAGDTVEGIK
jgi:formylmethanofuran dehydrogenase subunit E